MLTCLGAVRPLAAEPPDLACDLSRQEWREYHEAYELAAQASASEDAQERSIARARLAEALLQRTGNLSDVLTCNVGVIAGYHLVARLIAPTAVATLGRLGTDDPESVVAYRLLQMALVFIFTLRNANRIPEGPGAAWGVTEHTIIPSIMELRRGYDARMRQRFRWATPVAPSFRDPSLSIAIVSICAYPPDHPLDLPKVTPPNRDAYARRHDYALRLHLEPPVIGAPDLGLQHAKLATVLSYLQSGEFDWVAWLDCDSIIMNPERTLDSIIYQYTQVVDAPLHKEAPPVCRGDDGPEPPLPDLSGVWFDSWVPEDVRDMAVVHIVHSPGGVVSASARQFGDVPGRMVGAELELDFPDGALRASVDLVGATEVRLRWDNGAEWSREASITYVEQETCRTPCREKDDDACAAISLDPEVNLLVTEEGWGLSSANWMIRRSAWSMRFLDDALTAAHVDLRLFGDQDGMIVHLMNEQALQAAATAGDAVDPVLELDGALSRQADPLDRHAAVVPQSELNSYDALNALTMDCDMYVEGDLLVTFPQCKDAEGCNDVFNLAAEYGKADDKALGPDAGAWWARAEGPITWPRYSPQSSASLRVFGPRPLVRQVYLRERSMH